MTDTKDIVFADIIEQGNGFPRADDLVYDAPSGQLYRVTAAGSRIETQGPGRGDICHGYTLICVEWGDSVEHDVHHCTVVIIGNKTNNEVRCDCGTVTKEPCAWSGPEDQTVELEWMPEHLRTSHDAAGNYGQWPDNGAIRIRVESSCADRILQNDDEWSTIVG